MNLESGFIDLHHHILPDMDDGPKTYEEAVEMLRAASAHGVRHLAATPHVCPGLLPFDRCMYDEKLASLQSSADALNLPVTLLPGAEIAYTYQTANALRCGSIPTINGTQYALIELWQDISWFQIREASQKILRAGFIPVFAHIERYSAFLWCPEKAIQLKKDLPVCYQMNADTLLKRSSLLTSRFLKKMLKERAIDIIASDAHGVRRRSIHLKPAYELIRERCGEEYACQLFSYKNVLNK